MNASDHRAINTQKYSQMQMISNRLIKTDLKIIIAILCAFSLNVALASAKDVGSINIVGNVLPPFGIENKGKLAGFSIATLERLLDSSALRENKRQIQLVSFARAYAQLEARPRTIALHFARGPSRENKFKWLGPYHNISMGLVGLKNIDVEYSTFDDLKDLKVAVVRDTLLQDILMTRGFPEENMVLISDPISGIKMLNAGRVSFFAHIPSVLRHIKEYELNMDAGLLEEKYTLQTGEFYFAMSADFDDELVAQLQTLLQAMQARAAFDDLLLEHGLIESVQ